MESGTIVFWILVFACRITVDWMITIGDIENGKRSIDFSFSDFKEVVTHLKGRFTLTETNGV